MPRTRASTDQGRSVGGEVRIMAMVDLRQQAERRSADRMLAHLNAF
jgi:hypothetical protein